MSKKKESKGYSTGSGKKWLAIFGVLVLVAIIVVVVILVIPANTYNMVETVKTASETSFLTNSAEKNNMNDFKAKVSSNEKMKKYQQEINDMMILASSVSNIMIFYDDYIPVAEDNKVMSDNYKRVKNNLEESFDNQKNMNVILDNIAKLTDNSESYLKNNLIDFRNEYYLWVENNYEAMIGLANCYQGCFSESITTNKASGIILNTVNDFMCAIKNDFAVLVKLEVKGHYSEYSYKSSGKISTFSNFVDVYLGNNQTDIIKYNFDQSIKTKYDKISEFFTVYNEPNLYAVVNSISSAAGNPITKTYENVSDTKGLYGTVKSFIRG